MKFVILITLILTCPIKALTHPGHSDPILAELNDYLMAIQILRTTDPEADQLFAEWQELREASWNIRKLTDEDNLTIVSQEVMEQIGRTRQLQGELLAHTREYFRKMHQKQGGPNIEIGTQLEITPAAGSYRGQVDHKEVVVLRIANRRDSVVRLDITSSPNDELLHWDKNVAIEPGGTRYDFVVGVPRREHSIESTLSFRDGVVENQTRVTFRGIPKKTPPLVYLPGKDYVLAQPDSARLGSNAYDWTRKIVIQAQDRETSEPLAVRAEVFDSDSNFYWSPLRRPAVGLNRSWGWDTPLWQYQPGPYFYFRGNVELGAYSEDKSVRLFCGFEYLPETIKVPADGHVQVKLSRWIDMPARGWYSGQTHIHTTDAGMPVQFSKYWPLVSQGEDLRASAVLTLKGEWSTHAIYADEFPMGLRKEFSTDDHLIFYGQEYRNNPYGHLIFLGIDRLVQPISTGALGELGGPDYPPNSFALDEALGQDANTIAAHFGLFRRVDSTIQTPWPSTGYEMPVDVALGKIQLAEIYGNGGQLDVWYDLLNCGFRIAATAGPDWVIKDAPRVYVHLGDSPFTMENWLEAHKAGRSFITRGPMLFLEANGKKPGTIITAGDQELELEISAAARIPSGQLPIELIFNGTVIGQGTDLDTTLVLDKPGWLSARTDGAHTNPIYIEFPGRTMGMKEPAENFIAVIDRLSDWVREKGLFYTDKQRETVLDELNKGRAVYEEIIKNVSR